MLSRFFGGIKGYQKEAKAFVENSEDHSSLVTPTRLLQYTSCFETRGIFERDQQFNCIRLVTLVMKPVLQGYYQVMFLFRVHYVTEFLVLTFVETNSKHNARQSHGDI